MSDFNEAVELVLRHEGGWVNDPDDPGGETNFGISKRQFPSLDIKNLTREQAKEIYRKDYWLPLYDGIENQEVANSLFDMAVNAGVQTAIKLLQRTLNELLAGPLVVDGVFGPKTLSAVNACDGETLYKWFTIQRITYYASLNKQKFIKGWVRRAMDA